MFFQSVLFCHIKKIILYGDDKVTFNNHSAQLKAICYAAPFQDSAVSVNTSSFPLSCLMTFALCKSIGAWLCFCSQMCDCVFTMCVWCVCMCCTEISCGDVHLPGNHGPCPAPELQLFLVSAHSNGLGVQPEGETWCLPFISAFSAQSLEMSMRDITANCLFQRESFWTRLNVMSQVITNCNILNP